MSDPTTPERPAPDSPFLVERLLRQAWRESDDEEAYASEEEFHAAVTGAVGEDLLERRLAVLQEDPLERAQELAYHAYEASDGEDALERAERALQLDPGNCDARCVKSFLVCEDMGTLIAALDDAVAEGERRLGPDFFVEAAGDFWSLVQARPYLRTVKQLAEVLWTVGRRFDAVAHYEDLLDLDPDDHLGNAALLLGYYLAMGEVQRAWDVVEQHDDGGAVMSWSWVLLLVLVDDEDAAREALTQAMEANPYVAPWLLGIGEPETTPSADPFIQPGSQDEAHVCVDILAEAWLREPDAQWWLHDRLVELGLIDSPEEEADEGPPPVN
jgi:tetratricopeptide (TPR) repeat protein